MVLRFVGCRAGGPELTSLRGFSEVNYGDAMNLLTCSDLLLCFVLDVRSVVHCSTHGVSKYRQLAHSFKPVVSLLKTNKKKDRNYGVFWSTY